MKKLKRSYRSKKVFGIALGLFLPFARGFAAGPFELSKSLTGGAGGVQLSGGPFAGSFAWGEAAASQTMMFSSQAIDSGYYGGRFGAGQTFNVLGVKVGGMPSYFQNGLQIGVTVQALVEFTFSDLLDPSSIGNGIQGTLLQDHLSQPQNQPVSLLWDYDPVGNVLKVKPDPDWIGNSVYDIRVVPGIVSVSGYALNASTSVQFLTMADPHQDNVIVNALLESHTSSLGINHSVVDPPFKLEVPPEALSDYSVLLFTSSSEKDPFQLDPLIVEEANRKARLAGGEYQTPLRFIEIEAYTPEGKRLQRLSQPARVSVSYASSGPWAPDAPVPIHVSSLALWTLDSGHRLWVKIPASLPIGQTVTAPVTQLSVFALMGSAAGQAQDVFVFPIPWRPSGPNAGNGPGQTGSEHGGMTFNNLPSECGIKIYTLDGQLIRKLRHSDTIGPVAQEVWDGKTFQGASAASGVYLWRVESGQDGKNGKLMIIR